MRLSLIFEYAELKSSPKLILTQVGKKKYRLENIY
jgi:hypothetical protein